MTKWAVTSAANIHRIDEALQAFPISQSWFLNNMTGIWSSEKLHIIEKKPSNYQRFRKVITDAWKQIDIDKYKRLVFSIPKWRQVVVAF